MRRLLDAAVAALLLLVPGPAATAAGFQYGSAPDPDGAPLELAIWYPSEAPVSPQPLGLFTQDVAPYSPISGPSAPLIVISHGTGGGATSHYDTALALADAGFVVVAASHTGDNYKDRSLSFTRRNFADRARHVSRIIDFMVNVWEGRPHLDVARIGMFGHSAGGATTLIAIGGNPEMERGTLHCRDHPTAWDCLRVKEKTQADPAAMAEPATPIVWTHDRRIKAAVIAAPAIGYTFSKDALAGVGIPVQLWRAENDEITPNPWNGDFVAANLPKPPENHLVARAGHFDFLAPCSEALAAVAPAICSSAPGFDRTAFHRQFNEALVAFFKAQLPPP